MRVFLFLYPVKPYVDGLILKELDLSPRPYAYGRINEIIDIRYRQRGYAVFWLFFAKNASSSSPDTDALSPFLKVLPSDHVISADVPYETEGRFQYVDSAHVLSQLPVTITELMLGGFHQGDCVSRVAEAAYARGIKTVVDEDTTDHFFAKLHLGHHIPDLRHCDEEGFGGWLEYQNDVEVLCCRVAQRQGKPWFIIPRFVLSR